MTTIATGLTSWGIAYLTTHIEDWSKPEESVAVSVETNPAKVGTFGNQGISGVLPPGKKLATAPGPGCDGFHPWLQANDGIDAGVSKIQVLVEGKASGQVQISNLRVIVLGKETPSSGVLVRCPSAGGANLRTIQIDLDRSLPKIQYLDKEGRPFGFTVEKGEVETFLVTATAEKARYSWRLEMDITVDGERKTVRVQNNGKPFQTAPDPHAGGWTWNYKDSWMQGEKRVGVGESFPAPASREAGR
ncbi:hypothetical protein [Streptomyces sp. NPDC053079]|uniref:hypothetical protein n=1 Tax=Streptomyces sp. NPDC053079 TaxID=3365697 RepID=UPI0037D386D1